MSDAAWPLITNHGLVLVALARRADLRIREIADEVGITERAVQGIVGDLVSVGLLERTREGRRNRYLVRGDRALRAGLGGDVRVADLLGLLARGPEATPGSQERLAVVLACSDHRYQEPLRDLIAVQGLLQRAETILWPGGASALAGPDAERIVATLGLAARRHRAGRLLLVAHQGCRVPGAYLARRPDPLALRRAVTRRRRQAVDRVRRELGLEPELWFLSERGARRVRAGGALDPRLPRTGIAKRSRGPTKGAVA